VELFGLSITKATLRPTWVTAAVEMGVPVTTATGDAIPRGRSKAALAVSDVKWLQRPAKRDYPAAKSYLSLNLHKKIVNTIIHKLAQTKCVNFKAKDILRASGLPLLSRSNPDVQKELARVAAGESLSPCLLIRGRLEKGRLAQIADGYHRICASNYVNEDADIPIQIVDL
jgi:hypothetical protein